MYDAFSETPENQFEGFIAVQARSIISQCIRQFFHGVAGFASERFGLPVPRLVEGAVSLGNWFVPDYAAAAAAHKLVGLRNAEMPKVGKRSQRLAHGAVTW